VTFQAYLDTIKEKTGLGPDDFRRLAEEKGLLASDAKVTQIVDWLKADFDLGRGHAMALVATFRTVRGADKNPVDLIGQQFRGARSKWRETYEKLLTTLATFGPVRVAPTNSYLSLLKGRSKFAIVAVTADHLDIGIKLKDAPAEGRFGAAGNWNAMVTHRVQITNPAQFDAELVTWLRKAYDAS
jgi:Domain of unknown function (DUF4287)/Domain of unknown function (DUF5655)